MPPVDSIMAMQDFWSGLLQLCREEGDAEQLFDLSVAKEAKAASIGKSRSVRERAGSSHASDQLVGPVPPCRRAGPGEFMTNEFWRWQACDLARAIRTRRISSREAVTSCLARLAAVNPRINAVVDCLADEALAAADAADRAVATGEPLGPLHGVPVTIKINVDYAGRATTNGVVAFKDRIAQADSPPVANWRKAGAIFIGRTNVPAFSARFFTDNALHGRTLNPWDAGRTPGGSSGGAAAAVATGIGALAHGNDRAGSIRYPAYACGVVGLRPTLGRIPTFEPGAPDEPSITTQLDSRAGPAGALGARPAARPSRDGGARSARSVVGAGATRASSCPRARCDASRCSPRSPESMSTRRSPPPCGKPRTWLEEAGYEVEEAAPPRLDEAGPPLLHAGA